MNELNPCDHFIHPFCVLITTPLVVNRIYTTFEKEKNLDLHSSVAVKKKFGG